MEPNWSQPVIFPMIARAIESIYENVHRFVTHDEIVNALLNDEEAASYIEGASDAAQNERTSEWSAHNMVAWFSQRITVGESDWAARFDREKIGDKWAYKPRS